MTGNPKVQSVLQQAINSEATCMLQYHLDKINMKRLGIAIESGFDKLGEQCEEFLEELARRLMFLEGSPIIAADTAKMHDNLASALGDAQAYEVGLVGQYALATEICRTAGDMSNFHYFQHLSKWHREGDTGHTGHLSFLQQKLWQLNAVGEVGLIQENI